MSNRSYNRLSSSRTVAPAAPLFSRHRPVRLSNRRSRCWAYTIQLWSPNAAQNLLNDQEAALLGAQLTLLTPPQIFNHPGLWILKPLDLFFQGIMNDVRTTETSPVTPRRDERPPVNNPSTIDDLWPDDVPIPPTVNRSNSLELLTPQNFERRQPEVIEISDSDEDFQEAQVPPWQDPVDHWNESQQEETDPRTGRPHAPFNGPFEVLENTVKWKKINSGHCRGLFTGRFEIGEQGNIHLQCLLLADGPPDQHGKYNGVSRCTSKIFIENIYASLGADYMRIPDKTWLGTCASKPCDKGAWVRQLEYCTTLVEKSGEVGNGHFEYGVMPPSFAAILAQNAERGNRVTKSAKAAELVQQVRERKWCSTDDMIADLTGPELAKVGRFLKSGGLFDRIFEVERRRRLYEVMGTERLVVWIYGPAGIGKDRVALWAIARKWLKENWASYRDDNWASQVAWKTNDKWWASGDPEKQIAIWSDARLEYTDGNGNVSKGIPYVDILTLFDRITTRPVEVKGRMCCLETRVLIVTAPESVRDFVRPLDGVTHDNQNAAEQLVRRVNVEMTIEGSSVPDNPGEVTDMNDWGLKITNYVAPKARDAVDRSAMAVANFTDDTDRARMEAFFSFGNTTSI